MIQKAASILWTLSSELQGQIPSSEYVSVFSQLCVLAKLAKEDSDFRSLVESAMDSGSVPSREILDAADSVLRRLEIDNSLGLIDTKDPNWSAVSTAWLLRTLRALRDDRTTQLERGKWLLSGAVDKSWHVPRVPTELLRFLRQLNPNADSVYLPFDTSAMSVLELTDDTQSVTLRPNSQLSYQLVNRALFVADRKATVQLSDPYSKAEVPPSPLTILIPPFGDRLESARVLGLPDLFQGSTRLTSEEVAIASLAGDFDRTIIALVPSGLLFRGGLSRLLREWLVEHVGLVSVIEFPPRVLSNASIGCAVLVINPGGLLTRTVRLISAERGGYLEEYQSGRFRVSKWRELAAAVWAGDQNETDGAVRVPTSDVRRHDYVLNPARYKTSNLQALLANAPTVKLNSVCNIIRPVPVKSIEIEGGRTFHEVLMSDFDRDGTVSHGSRDRVLSVAQESKVRQQILEPGDILLGVKGTIGKVAIVANDAAQDLLAGQTIVVLRLHEDGPISHPEYLLRYLSQPEVSTYLESLAGGSAISFIRAKDLASLQVPIRPAEEQAKVKEIHDEIISAIAESERLVSQADALNRRAFRPSGQVS